MQSFEVILALSSSKSGANGVRRLAESGVFRGAGKREDDSGFWIYVLRRRMGFGIGLMGFPVALLLIVLSLEGCALNATKEKPFVALKNFVFIAFLVAGRRFVKGFTGGGESSWGIDSGIGVAFLIILT